MALHVEGSILNAGNDEDACWNNTYRPGEEVPVSGIYRCQGCNREIAANMDNGFPPQNYHQHHTKYGPVLWKLNIKAET